MTFSNSCTFFKVISRSKDISFNPKPLSKILLFKTAKSDYYYLLGNWEFHHLEGINWIAVRIVENYKEEVISEDNIPF